MPASIAKMGCAGRFFPALRTSFVAIAAAALGGIFVCAAPSATSPPAPLTVPDAPVAPVPADAHELATGPIEAPSTPTQISDIFDLIDRARTNMIIYRSGDLAFTSKVSFTSSGGPFAAGSANANAGAGKIEDTLLPSGKERWSASLGNFSIVRIFDGNLAYDEKSPGPIPLRIQMLCAAIWWPFTSAMTQDSVRTTSSTWDGKKVTCVLLSHNSGPPPPAGRGWNETEFCVDPKSHLLEVYSEVPGVYVVYDYHGAAQFHGRTLPRHITIFQGGSETPGAPAASAVIDAHVDSIEDAGAVDPRAFQPPPTATAPGALLVAPVHAQAPGILASVAMIEPMIVHATVGDDGAVMEEEPLQVFDPALSRVALDLVRRTRFMQKILSGRPGQRDMYVEVDFLPKTSGGQELPPPEQGNRRNR